MNWLKYPLILTLLVTTTIAYAQPSPGDTIWLPRKDALRKLALADSARAYMIILNQTRADLDTVTAWVNRMGIQLKLYQLKDSNNLNIISTLKGEKNDLLSTQGMLADQISKLNQQLSASERKRKRARTWTRIGALVGMGGAFYIGLKL